MWRELGGDVFSNSAPPVDSFNIYNDDSEAIQQKLEEFVSSSEIDILVVHSLLVDHNAHKTGTSSPSDPHIYRALLQFNRHKTSSSTTFRPTRSFSCSETTGSRAGATTAGRRTTR